VRSLLPILEMIPFSFKSNGSCDCIAARANKELIAPGDTTLLMVYFDTKGRKGPQLRKIELTCNTDPAEVFITLKTDVELTIHSILYF